MRLITEVYLSLTLLAALGCNNPDLTPASWTDAWQANPIQGTSWKSQKGAWSLSSRARDIERNFGYE